MSGKEDEARTALEDIGKRAKEAARQLAATPTEVKDAALRAMAAALRKTTRFSAGHAVTLSPATPGQNAP